MAEITFSSILLYIYFTNFIHQSVTHTHTYIYHLRGQGGLSAPASKRFCQCNLNNSTSSEKVNSKNQNKWRTIHTYSSYRHNNAKHFLAYSDNKAKATHMIQINLSIYSQTANNHAKKSSEEAFKFFIRESFVRHSIPSARILWAIIGLRDQKLGEDPIVFCFA